MLAVYIDFLPNVSDSGANTSGASANPNGNPASASAASSLPIPSSASMLGLPDPKLAPHHEQRYVLRQTIMVVSQRRRLDQL